MPSAFSGLEIAKRGLFAQQSALYTTGHNISNANTEGYTRQRVNMEATPAIPLPSMVNDRTPGQMGTGVTVKSLQRLREDFLDSQFRGENKYYGEWEAKTDTLEKIETIMNEPSDTGLQHTLDQFWQSWQDLSLHPEDMATREIVRQRGETVTETFDFMHRSLTDLQKDINTVIGVKTSEMNSYLEQIKEINKQIGDVVPHGYQPNDLYDQRDVLLDKLSKMADISTEPASNGMVNVFVNTVNVNQDGTKTPQKVQLIDGRTKVDVTAEADNTGNFQVKIADNPVAFGTGEIAALMESRGVPTEITQADGTKQTVLTGIIPSYLKRMDELATKIAEQMNQVHSSGIDLAMMKQYRDQQQVTEKPVPFFVSKKDPAQPPADASDMSVNPAILDSLSKIAAAQTYIASPSKNTNGTSFEGDGSNARALAALKFTKVNFSSTNEETTIDDFTRYNISKIGVETQEAQRLKGNSSLLTGQIENRRQSVSGVSIDEEMSNMIKYQHAYNAAARTITATDEMLDKIINSMGLVGR